MAWPLSSSVINNCPRIDIYRSCPHRAAATLRRVDRLPKLCWISWAVVWGSFRQLSLQDRARVLCPLRVCACPPAEDLYLWGGKTYTVVVVLPICCLLIAVFLLSFRCAEYTVFNIWWKSIFAEIIHLWEGYNGPSLRRMLYRFYACVCAANQKQRTAAPSVSPGTASLFPTRWLASKLLSKNFDTHATCIFTWNLSVIRWCIHR